MHDHPPLEMLEAWRRDLRRKQINWKQHSGTLPCNTARAHGETWIEENRKRIKHGPRPHYLPLPFADCNLLPNIRSSAISRFSARRIRWHGYSTGPNGDMWPSSHLLDSQVQCVNVFLSLERNGLLFDWARDVAPGVERLVEVEDGSAVTFEWSGAEPDADYLDELRGRPAMRGEYRTSADAFLVAEHSGRKVALLVEWKFTEHDAHEVALIPTRERSYAPRLHKVFSKGTALGPFFENAAAYQLMRLHLLAREIVARNEFGATSAIVVQCVPARNVWERGLVPTALHHHGRMLSDAWPKLLESCDIQFRCMSTEPLMWSTAELAERYDGRYEPLRPAT